MMGNSRIQVWGDGVCFGGERDIIRNGGDAEVQEEWICGPIWGFFSPLWVTQGKVPQAQVLLLPSCFTPKHICPRQGAKEVLSFLWKLHFHLFNLPAYSSVTTVSLVLVLIFFSLTEVAQYCQVTLKMGSKALFHNINVIRNSPQEASEMNSPCSKENKVTWKQYSLCLHMLVEKEKEIPIRKQVISIFSPHFSKQ